MTILLCVVIIFGDNVTYDYLRLWASTSLQTTSFATSVLTQRREFHTKYGKFNENISNRKTLYAVIVGASVAATYGIYRYATGKQV